MAAVCFACLTANAQAEVGSITIMPKVGLTFADLTDASGSDMKIGLVAGAEAEYQMNEKFSLGAGLLYSMQGCKIEENYNMDYICIPLLAQYEVKSGLKVKAGLQPAFLMSAKWDGNDVKDACETFDLSIPVGVSYQISDFVLDARYNFGLSKAFKVGDSKNSVIALTVGYKFAL